MRDFLLKFAEKAVGGSTASEYLLVTVCDKYLPSTRNKNFAKLRGFVRTIQAPRRYQVMEYLDRSGNDFEDKEERQAVYELLESCEDHAFAKVVSNFDFLYEQRKLQLDNGKQKHVQLQTLESYLSGLFGARGPRVVTFLNQHAPYDGGEREKMRARLLGLEDVVFEQVLRNWAPGKGKPRVGWGKKLQGLEIYINSITSRMAAAGTGASSSLPVGKHSHSRWNPY